MDTTRKPGRSIVVARQIKEDVTSEMEPTAVAPSLGLRRVTTSGQAWGRGRGRDDATEMHRPDVPGVVCTRACDDVFYDREGNNKHSLSPPLGAFQKSDEHIGSLIAVEVNVGS